MVSEDKMEKERIDARNALEEYVYDLRSKLGDDTQLAPFVLQQDRSSLSQLLDETENWLYEEGEECLRNVYCDKLAHLRVSLEICFKKLQKLMEFLSSVVGRANQGQKIWIRQQASLNWRTCQCFAIG